MEARIYKPADNAMQSGRGGSAKAWVLEFPPSQAQKPDDLMGWVGGGSTMDQIRIRFATREEAESYAKRKGIAYQLSLPAQRKPRIKNYADNFRFDRVR